MEGVVSATLAGLGQACGAPGQLNAVVFLRCSIDPSSKGDDCRNWNKIRDGGGWFPQLWKAWAQRLVQKKGPAIAVIPSVFNFCV